MKKINLFLGLLFVFSIASHSQTSDAEFYHSCVAATKCNVLYRGLDNPVNIAVAEVAMEDILVSVSDGAKISKQANSFIVNVLPDCPNEVDIVISMNSDDGPVNISTHKFRVFSVPAPQIFFAGAYRDGNRIPRAAIFNNPTLSARLESDFFPFGGGSYNVVKYELAYEIEGVVDTKVVNSNKLSQDIIDIIKEMSAGSTLTFTGINVEGPSGRMMTQGITVIIQ